jgi:outer membrane protein OmpA-like peptidoglycan-associated protein
LRRNEITGSVALGILVLLAALLALRFDLLSLLFPDTPRVVDTPRASAPKRIGTAVGGAPVERRPADDRVAEASGSTFDVVRIDPEGSSVFAGRAPANANVTVLANEKPVATAKADEGGAWAAVIDRKFAPGDYQLSLSAKPSGSGPQVTGQSVNVTIASNAQTAPPEVKTAAMPAAPAPILFAYDEAKIAATGRNQAAALREFLRQRQLAAVTLTGHADERGSDAYNMQLSRNRLENVARYLRESGYAGRLVLVPKGRSEPFVGADRIKLPKEDAFRLDRRVELRLQ